MAWFPDPEPLLGFQSFLGSELITRKKTDAKSILEVFSQYLVNIFVICK